MFKPEKKAKPSKLSKCKSCGGRGVDDGVKCSECKGKGKV